MTRRAAGLLALSIAGGVLMALAFPLGSPLPFDNADGWWWAGWICLAPVMLAAAGARRISTAFALGLLSGATAFGSILCWIFPFLVRWARLSAFEAGGVGGLLILYNAFYTALFAACVQRWVRRWGQAAALLLAPAGWTGLELARGVLFTGFPWCLLGYSQRASSAAAQVADLGGVYGVSFVLAAAGAALAWLTVPAATGGKRAEARGIGVPLTLAGIVVAALGYGAWRLRTLPEGSPTLRVALVQANVAQADKWDPAETDRIEADHVALTRRAAARGARLIVWSESSVPVSITHHPDYARRLEALAGETGSDLLVGTVTYAARDGTMAPFNSAVLVSPGAGITGRYDKVHLVPFGEYVPLKRLLFFLAPLVQEASDFRPGDGIRLLDGRIPSIGTLICYEAIFPELTRRYARTGASLLVNITNDAWYGATAMPRQHLMQAAMRAVESRRWLLRCANTGISAVIAPSGRLTARSAFERQEVIEGDVAPLAGRTVYATVGDVFAIACVILTLAALSATYRRTRHAL